MDKRVVNTIMNKTRKKLKLNILWHMHQPYYKDDKDAVTVMPWVFLHATKDYYDIPWYSEKYNSVKATFNLVPSLIYQLKAYINNSANDKLLETVKKHTNALTSEDISVLQSYLFLSNEKNMIKPLERYYELYLKYKTNNTIKNFDPQEILDSEVLFLLAWSGNYLRENNPIVKKLLEKRHYYTHEEKLQLIETLIEFLPTILEYYEKLSNEGKITLCTTPYYHPITPLLLDINSAKDAKKNVTLPLTEVSFKEFAVKNTQCAIDYFEEIFHKKPTGFWPAEGSVSFETAKLFLENGLKWFCTDEEILFKSIHNRDKKNIYKNYKLDINGRSIQVRFRDHYLSDAIGFEYSQKDPQKAASEFIGHLKHIYDSCGFSPLVNVILDGENAWEFFPENAKRFFNELYTALEQTPWVECITMDQVEEDNDIEHIKLEHLSSGSWINGNFDIWIGSNEKNKAWELLDLAKKDFDKQKEHMNKEVVKLIEKEFMIALGSDWFWWYGDEHYTVLAHEFDELFRKHLINIYKYMNMDIPPKILKPIPKENKTHKFHTPPKSFINARIDGAKSSYFEWLDCGIIDISKEFSVMDGSKNVITKVLYGYDKSTFSFLFEGKKLQSYTLVLYLNDSTFEFSAFQKEYDGITYISTPGTIELKLSKDIISFKDEIKFSFEIRSKEKSIQSFPIYSDFYIKIDDIELKNWYV